MTGKERFTEKLFLMQQNSFILNVLEARIAAVLHAEGMGYSDTETALISHISTEYVKLIRAVKTQHPGSIEDIAQELYDRIYVQTGWKRDYSRFQLFDEELIAKWFEIKEQERQLRAGNIDLDALVSDIKHAYWSKTGKDVTVIVKEIEQKQQEKKKETEPETEREPEMTDAEMLEAFRERMVKEEVLVRMFLENAISEAICRKYMDAEDLSAEAFLKIVEMYKGDDETEPDVKIDVDSWCETQKKEHQMEIIAQLVAGGAITPEVAFEYMNKDNDFDDFDNFLRILDIWTGKEAETDE